MRDKRHQAKARPWVTVTVLAITAAMTAVQFVAPAVLRALERTPEALHHHQYWRLITPILVQSDGWPQILFNFPAIAITGYFVEANLGGRFFLTTYLVSGFVGELAGYAWQPIGAGSSVAGAGLLGALALWILFRARAPQAKLAPLIILTGAFVLTAVHDIHGPPIIVGALLALVSIRLEAKTNNRVLVRNA